MVKEIYFWVADNYHNDIDRSFQFVIDGNLPEDKKIRTGDLTEFAKRCYDLANEGYSIKNDKDSCVKLIESLGKGQGITINRPLNESEFGKLEKEILKVHFS